MENLPQKDIFKIPEGYFEELPDKILARHHKEKSRSVTMVIRYAAAAVIVIGFGLIALFNINEQDQILQSNLNDEINLYINSDYWQAEDVLGLADNPNIILDEIILAEWGSYEWEDEDNFENEMWF